MKKTILTLCLAIVASVGTMYAEVITGYCGAEGDGSNLQWSLDTETGVLDITGSGAMMDFEMLNPDLWQEYSESIIAVSLPEGLTSIGQWAFGDCRFEEVIIPNSVTKIDKWAFQGCRSLKSVTLPNSVTFLGESAFFNCNSLTTVNLSNSITSIEKQVFKYCNLESMTIPNNVTSIGEQAFENCGNLTSVTIPSSVTFIGYSAFHWTGLKEVNIPDGVESIDHSAFRQCYSLVSVTIGSTLASMEDEVFWGCESLSKINVDVNNPNFCDVDGVLYDKKKTRLIHYPAAKVETWYEIPQSVKTIGGGAFCICRNLKTIIIPNGVSEIGNDAFVGCIYLTSMVIPNSVTSVGERAFEDCWSMTSIIIGRGVTQLKKRTLWGCKGLTEIVIPKSVTKIEPTVFYDCTGLKSLTCEAKTPPTCTAKDVLYDIDKSIPLYVPAGSVDAYKAADQWRDFGDNIQPISASEAEVTEVKAEPSAYSVVVEWPAVTGATVYTIEIRKGEELVCTISFNGDGQLLSIDFTKKARPNELKNALQTATGWKYTISGLEAGTTYSYTIIAKNGTTELFNQTKQFTTTMPTAIEEVESQESRAESRKVLRDGRLLIEKAGKTYTVSGIILD